MQTQTHKPLEKYLRLCSELEKQYGVKLVDFKKIVAKEKPAQAIKNY